MSQLKAMNKVSVVVNLKNGSSSTTPKEAVSLSFIYGIGREGLSDFECCLEGGHSGEHRTLRVKGPEVAESFGVLFPVFRTLVDGMIIPEMLEFDIEIIGIEEVEHREIVAALAGSAGGCGSGGSSGSCGCGCSS